MWLGSWSRKFQNISSFSLIIFLIHPLIPSSFPRKYFSPGRFPFCSCCCTYPLWPFLHSNGCRRHRVSSVRVTKMMVTASTDPLSSSTHGFLLTTSFTPFLCQTLLAFALPGLCTTSSTRGTSTLCPWCFGRHPTIYTLQCGSFYWARWNMALMSSQQRKLAASRFKQVTLSCLLVFGSGECRILLRWKKKRKETNIVGKTRRRRNRSKNWADNLQSGVEILSCLLKFFITHQIWFKDPYWFRHNPGPRTKRENLAERPTLLTLEYRSPLTVCIVLFLMSWSLLLTVILCTLYRVRARSTQVRLPYAYAYMHVPACNCMHTVAIS